jgi:hypothetical protein
VPRSRLRLFRHVCRPRDFLQIDHAKFVFIQAVAVVGPGCLPDLSVLLPSHLWRSLLREQLLQWTRAKLTFDAWQCRPLPWTTADRLRKSSRLLSCLHAYLRGGRCTRPLQTAPRCLKAMTRTRSEIPLHVSLRGSSSAIGHRGNSNPFSRQRPGFRAYCALKSVGSAHRPHLPRPPHHRGSPVAPV